MPLIASVIRLATRPLRLCEDAFAARGARRISFQFRMVRMYVYMTWHAFPAVWAAAAYGRLDSNGRESLFVLCDRYIDLMASDGL